MIDLLSVSKFLSPSGDWKASSFVSVFLGSSGLPADSDWFWYWLLHNPNNLLWFRWPYSVWSRVNWQPNVSFYIKTSILNSYNFLCRLEKKSNWHNFVLIVYFKLYAKLSKANRQRCLTKIYFLHFYWD